MSYRYVMFGYGVESEFDLGIPETSISNIDISILDMGVVEAESLPGGAVFGIEVIEDGIIFRLTDSGRITIRRREIRVEVYESGDTSAISLYLKGSVMGAWLLLNNRFAIHGSAIQYKEHALVITGESGAGKSSLARGFIDHGHQILSDDVSLLLKKDDFYIESSYAAQKLWNDTANHYQISYEDHQRITYRDDKYNINIEDAFCSHAMKLGAVVYLRSHEGPCKLSKLPVSEGLECLLNNVYMDELMEYFDLDMELFRTFTGLASQIPVYLLERTKDKMTVDNQIDLITKSLVFNCE